MSDIGWDAVADTHTITGAQYDALMGAVKALEPFKSGPHWGVVMAWIVAGAGKKDEGIGTANGFVKLQCRVDEALAALRAAGILEEGT